MVHREPSIDGGARGPYFSLLNYCVITDSTKEGVAALSPCLQLVTPQGSNGYSQSDGHTDGPFGHGGRGL